MNGGVAGSRGFPHGLSLKCHPGVPVQSEAGVEFGAQPLGAVQREGDQGGRDVARNREESMRMTKANLTINHAEREIVLATA